MDNQQILKQLPRPEDKQPFTLLKIEEIVMPHPYCITPKHLEYADSMYLNGATIENAEQQGAKCDICRQLVRDGKKSNTLSFSDHETLKTLFIAVEDDHDLNQVEGLHEYLVRIKPQAESFGIQGFAFPVKAEASSDV